MAPRPVKVIDGKKTFTVLENNPETLSLLARSLGLSPSVEFYDIYSLDDPALTSHIPRPILALIAIIPMAPIWYKHREEEDASMPVYEGRGAGEKVLWFKQTIGHACGSIALIHACLNGPTRKFVLPGSTLDHIGREAVDLGVTDRAQLLYDNEDLEEKHQEAASLGDTIPPDQTEKNGFHFIAFVRTDDGGIWELEGGRPGGPLLRGTVGEGDVLSEEAVKLGIGKVMKAEREGGGSNLNFSLVALAVTY